MIEKTGLAGALAEAIERSKLPVEIRVPAPQPSELLSEDSALISPVAATLSGGFNADPGGRQKQPEDPRSQTYSPHHGTIVRDEEPARALSITG